MKLHEIRYSDHLRLPHCHDCHRTHPEETGRPKYGLLFPGREIIALLYARTLQCFRNVRHHRNDADGLLGICLRIQKPLDSLVVAGIQPNLLMVYLSVWLRRSNVLTGAEWIKTRFGKGKGSTLSHTIVIVFALLAYSVLSYGFIGIGKLWRYSSPGK